MNRTILLVDDDRSARHALAIRLTRAGYTAIEAQTLEAAACLLSQPIDIVCCQLKIRRGDAVEFLRNVGTRIPNVKTAIMSAANEIGLLAQVTTLKPDALFGALLDLEDFFD